MDDEKLARYDTVTHHDRMLSLILARSRHTSGGGHRARKIFISRGVAAFAPLQSPEEPILLIYFQWFRVEASAFEGSETVKPRCW